MPILKTQYQLVSRQSRTRLFLPVVRTSLAPDCRIAVPPGAGYRHARVNSGAEKYTYFDFRLGEAVSVNCIENFWHHLKCSINGMHTSLSPKFLGLYAKEFEYRSNSRNGLQTLLSELISIFQPFNGE